MKLSTIRNWSALAVWLWCVHGIARGDSSVAETAPVSEAGVEHFVPHVSRIDCSGTIQMVRSVEIAGNDIRVSQVCRWSDADSVGFSSVADLVIDHFDDATTRRISLDELRSTLKGAGANLSKVDFAGAASCLVTRDVTAPVTKAPVNDRQVVQQWIDQKPKPTDNAGDARTAAAIEKPAGSPRDDSEGVQTLRELLETDICQRLNVPAEDLQMTFDPKDNGFLNLSEPLFQFHLEPRRLTNLGKVSWDVTISNGAHDKKLTINADARLWEKQLVLARSVIDRQVLRDDDMTERRVLVDQVETDPLLTRDQIVGQQAARDLKPGIVLTARMLEPIPLVKPGDLVSVTLKCGAVSIRTVATAMETGCYGQSVKVRNEQNQNVFLVTLTGPQEASMVGK